MTQRQIFPTNPGPDDERALCERSRQFASRPNAPAALFAGIPEPLLPPASRFVQSSNRESGWFQAPVVTDGRVGFELRAVFVVAPSVDGLPSDSFWHYLTTFCARDNMGFKNVWRIGHITQFQNGSNHSSLSTSSLILNQVGQLPPKPRGSKSHRDFFDRLDEFVKPCSPTCSQCGSGHIFLSVGLEVYPSEDGKEGESLIRSIVAQHAHHKVDATHPHQVTTT